MVRGWTRRGSFCQVVLSQAKRIWEAQLLALPPSVGEAKRCLLSAALATPRPCCLDWLLVYLFLTLQLPQLRSLLTIKGEKDEQVHKTPGNKDPLPPAEPP